MASTATVSSQIEANPFHSAFDHLKQFTDRIAACKSELNTLRSHIADCMTQRIPVERTVRQQAHDCLSLMRRLKNGLKQHNAVHRETTRIIHRSPPRETKYRKTKLPGQLPKKTQSFHSSPQIKHLEARVNGRLKRERHRIVTKERERSPI